MSINTGEESQAISWDLKASGGDNAYGVCYAANELDLMSIKDDETIEEILGQEAADRSEDYSANFKEGSSYEFIREYPQAFHDVFEELDNEQRENLIDGDFEDLMTNLTSRAAEYILYKKFMDRKEEVVTVMALNAITEAHAKQTGALDCEISDDDYATLKAGVKKGIETDSFKPVQDTVELLSSKLRNSENLEAENSLAKGRGLH